MAGLVAPNFSPVYSLAFCAGAFLPGRMGWWLPVCFLLITDMLLNSYYDVPLLGTYMAVNYLGYAALIILGRRFSAAGPWLHLVSGGVLGALLFYLITNTGAWLNLAPGPFPQAPYPRSLWGWVQALTVGASPWPPTWTFLRNTVLSGGLFTALFVSGVSSLSRTEPLKEEPPEAIPGQSPTPGPEPQAS